MSERRPSLRSHDAFDATLAALITFEQAYSLASLDIPTGIAITISRHVWDDFAAIATARGITVDTAAGVIVAPGVGYLRIVRGAR